YAPDSFNAVNTGRRYYAIGLLAASAAVGACGMTGALPCNYYSYNATSAVGATCSSVDTPANNDNVLFGANVASNAAATKVTTLTGGFGAVARATFTIEADGQVSTTTTGLDEWTIDDQKVLTNQL